MNVIGNNWAQELLRRFWRVPAATALAPTLGTEIVPTMDVGNPPIELASLGGTMPGVITGTIANVAGQYGRITIENPTGSSRLVRVFRLWIQADTAMYVRIATGAFSSPVLGVAAGSRDSRYTAARSRVIAGGTNAVAQVVTNNYVNFYVPTTGAWIEYPAVLLPTSGVVVECATVNATLRVSAYFDERLAGPANFEVEGL